MTAYITHVVRFYAPEAKPIHNAALDEEKRFLALSRSDGSLELWHIAGALTTLCQSSKAWAKCAGGAPVCVARLPSCETGAGGDSVEALVWCGQRVYSAGLHGHVVRRCGASLRPLLATCAGGAALWSLAVDGPRRRLACGAEDGCVSLYQCADDNQDGDSEMVFCRRLARQEKRVLCLSWSEDGRHLAAGSVNSVALFCGTSGRVLSQLMVGRSGLVRRDTIVWSILVLNDMTVVTGDSSGHVLFWNGRLGALRQSVRTHRADVLALAGTDGSAICATGVDPFLVELRAVPSSAAAAPPGGGGSWVKCSRSQCHARDVRVLIVGDQWRLSAGVDSNLVFSSRDSFHSKIITSPVPQTECVVPLPALPGFAVNTGLSLQLWRLPAPSGGRQLPVKLVELQYRAGQPAISFAVSSDATWLAYSTRSCWLRVLHVELAAPLGPALQPWRHLPAAPSPRRQSHVTLTCMRFSGGDGAVAPLLHALTDDAQLVTVELPDWSQQLKLEEEEAAAGGGDIVHVRPLDAYTPAAAAAAAGGGGAAAGAAGGGGGNSWWPHLLECDASGRHVAVAFLNGAVLVLSGADSSSASADFVRLSSSSPATALAFAHRRGEKPRLIVAAADRLLVEYSLPTGGAAGAVTEWGSRWCGRPGGGGGGGLPGSWLARRAAVSRISVGQRAVLLHDHSALLSLPLSSSACSVSSASGDAAPAAAAPMTPSAKRRRTRRRKKLLLQSAANGGDGEPSEAAAPVRQHYTALKPTVVADRYCHVMCAAFVRSSTDDTDAAAEQLFVLEAPPDAVEQSLPPPFYRKQFGLG